jgi:hypothetical protein
MPTIHEIILAAGGGAFVVLALIGVFGVIFQQTVATWLNKWLGRSLERQADQYRHQLSREMETYKSELARSQDTERFKAEVRKSVAEKILERRLQALHEISLALETVPSWVVSVIRFPIAHTGIEAVTQRMTDYSRALDSNALYYPSDFSRPYRALAGQLFELITEWSTGMIFQENEPRLQAVILASGTLQYQIEGLHRSLPDQITNIMTVATPTAIAPGNR